MKARNAKITDTQAIYSLINSHAERDKMLFRSVADIYENLQSFNVAELDGKIIGCCALQIIWADLAEIKSLAVDQHHTGTGVGRMLVAAITEQAQAIGLPRIFALTLTSDIFVKCFF